MLNPHDFDSSCLTLGVITHKLKPVSSRLLLLCDFFQLIIPEEVPLAEDVDFEQLARFDMTGDNIKSAVFRAASRAALKGEGEQRVLARVAMLRGGGSMMSSFQNSFDRRG